MYVMQDSSVKDSKIASAIQFIFKNQFAQFTTEKIVFLTLSSASLSSIYYCAKKYNPEL